MTFNGHLEIGMDIHQYPWMASHGCRDIHGHQWISKHTHWPSMDIRGYPRFQMHTHDFPWISKHAFCRAWDAYLRHTSWAWQDACAVLDEMQDTAENPVIASLLTLFVSTQQVNETSFNSIKPRWSWPCAPFSIVQLPCMLGSCW